VKKTLIQVIGLGAFIIGGLLTRESAIEGIELLEDRIDKIKNKHAPEPPTE
jgi:hypothetical protein